MTQTQGNLPGIERGWRHLMRVLGKKAPQAANRNRIMLSVINQRMRSRG